MTYTFKVFRRDPRTKKIRFMPMTFTRNEIKWYGNGVINQFVKRDDLSTIVVKNKQFSRPIELHVKMKLEELKDLLGEEFEKVNLI